jgi:pimeloyl-ACP methyl ester carboxylesterase
VPDPARVVLVHGLWHGAWAWDGVRARLDAVGIARAAVELPLTGLADDVAATVAVLDRLDHPAVLVGHSYGGAVVTAAGAHPNVAHLLYLAAFQLAEGESVGRTLPEREIPPTGLGAALRFSDDGEWVSLDPAQAVDLLYADADPREAADAVARLRPVHRSVFRGVPDVIAWRRVPSTYVVCADDRAVHPDLQRAMAERATFRHEWPGGHSPALTRPGEVAELIGELSGRSG